MVEFYAIDKTKYILGQKEAARVEEERRKVSLSSDLM